MVPATGIGLICVCDRLLTGFDAPIEQVMYLDKSLREHDLFQAITRVNRTRKNKTFGLIVDYYGVTKHLAEALEIFTDNDKKELGEFLNVFRDINKEIPILEARYKRLLDVFTEQKLTKIEAFLNQQITDETQEFNFAEDCIEKAKNVKFRAELLTYAKSFFDSLDLLFNVQSVKSYWIPAKRLGYILWRIHDRYKDETMDLKFASEKVRRLIDKHLQSIGIDMKISQVSILSPEFQIKIDNLNKTPKSKASEMEHQIRWHIKMNMDNDPAFYKRIKDKLETILNAYQGKCEDIVMLLGGVVEEVAEGRKESIVGMSKIEAPFFDLIRSAVTTETPESIEDTKELVKILLVLLKETATINNFWDKLTEIKRKEGAVEQELYFSRIPGIAPRAAELTTELLKLAKKRINDLK